MAFPFQTPKPKEKATLVEIPNQKPKTFSQSFLFLSKTTDDKNKTKS